MKYYLIKKTEKQSSTAGESRTCKKSYKLDRTGQACYRGNHLRKHHPENGEY